MEPRQVEEQYETVASSKEPEAASVVARQGEAVRRDTIGSLQSRYEGIEAVATAKKRVVEKILGFSLAIWYLRKAV
jgi:hypothetical protein